MDYDLFYCISSTLIGIVIGLLIASVRYNQQHLKQEIERINLEQSLKATQQSLTNEQTIRRQAELITQEEERVQRDLCSKLAATEERLTSLAHFREKCEQLNQELRAQWVINSNQEAELRALAMRLKETQLAAEERQRLLTNNEQQLSRQFENLANRIFENSGRKVNEQNQQSLDRLLIPLREQLEGFRRLVQENFSKEMCERHTLTHEIRNLQKLNTKIAQEAVNLTHALKGDNKIQGNWGEVVLSKVLEASGLRKGHEFEAQINIQQNNGRRLQPDIVVRLPQNKNVIIDSKISLVAYERYFNSNNDAERQLALTEHINSLRSHIKLLGRKDYQQLPGLILLDYVLMFVPIEPAFIVAINQQPELISEALAHNIMLVSPTTLLVALRTINNLWRYEHQNHNTKLIADQAARLYNKLKLFIDDIHIIGQSLDKAQINYQMAKNKLYNGRGNIIAQAEKFRALGVEIKRPITPPTDIYTPLVDSPEDTDVNSIDELEITDTTQQDNKHEL